jgi:ribosome biogenesis protein YTM1
LSASYAGTLSLQQQQPGSTNPQTFSGHDLSVLSACYIHQPVPGINESKKLVASGGMDRIARVWEYEVSIFSNSSGVQKELIKIFFLSFKTPSLSLTDVEPVLPSIPKTLYTLSLHQGPISSVRSRSPFSTVSPSSSSVAPHLLTAGWDGLIGVWDLGKGVNEEEPLGGDNNNMERSKKKRRKSTSSENVKNKVSYFHNPRSTFVTPLSRKVKRLSKLTTFTTSCVLLKTPMSVLRGHTNKVSRALFDRNDSSIAYSAGWDHSVRVWDLQHGIEKENKVSFILFSSFPYLNPITKRRRSVLYIRLPIKFT